MSIREPFYGLSNLYIRGIIQSYRVLLMGAIIIPTYFPKRIQNRRIHHERRYRLQLWMIGLIGAYLRRRTRRERVHQFLSRHLLSTLSVLSAIPLLKLNSTLQTHAPVLLATTLAYSQLMLRSMSLEKQGVDNLKQLTLSKLHQILSVLRLDASNVQNLVDLTRYTYSDGRTPDSKYRVDKLRGMICYYIAANSGVTSEHATFVVLLKEE